MSPFIQTSVGKANIEFICEIYEVSVEVSAVKHFLITKIVMNNGHEFDYDGSLDELNLIINAYYDHKTSRKDHLTHLLECINNKLSAGANLAGD